MKTSSKAVTVGLKRWQRLDENAGESRTSGGGRWGAGLGSSLFCEALDGARKGLW